MSSNSRKRTTFAKLNRENKLRERRHEKQARKDARKQDAAIRREPADGQVGEDQPAAEAS